MDRINRNMDLEEKDQDILVEKRTDGKECCMSFYRAKKMQPSFPQGKKRQWMDG